ncbi:hypothetical protein BDW62DRAFT_175457 [Aspergillus aurantiobrunneus]
MDDMSMCSFPVWPQKIRHVWSNIFKVFCNLPPILDADGYGSILENCQMLAEMAEELQSTEVVSRAIQIALLGFDQQLYRLISQDPVSWIKLSVRIQSALIFRESTIHLVGKWGLLDETDRESLPKKIRTLCTQKLHNLDAIKKAVELRIVNHLPRPRSDTRYRETNNVFGWMALTFYQQWLCQSFAENRNHNAPDGGAAFYRAIAAGGDAYLNKLDQDIARFPASSETNKESTKGLKELEKDLNELKKGIMGFVSELLVNQAMYDPLVMGELPYLTCCKVSEEEMPLPEADTGGVMSYQPPEVRNSMAVSNMNNPNNNYLQQTFIPPEPMIDGPDSMMGLNNNLGNDYLLSPELNHPQSAFDTFNSFTHQITDPTITWDGALDFSAAALNPGGQSMPPLPELNDIFQTQTQFDQNSSMGENMGVFDMPPTTEGDGYLQNCSDGSMAFL